LYGGSGRALDERGETYEFSDWRQLPVRNDDEALPIVNGALRIPRVLQLIHYDRVPHTGVRLTRRNLMLRDGWRCQYCGRRGSPRELNVDHVLPRCRGGEDSWENLVASCHACNRKKGRRTPREAEMPLLSVPVRPRWSTAAQIAMSVQAPFSEWRPFLDS
ncbi:MAG TPA: HNH endonuclease, partial [Polyangiaceae bacterium]|nr:HNH endonuclease [Polyangiaceae bacterium]